MCDSGRYEFVRLREISLGVWDSVTFWMQQICAFIIFFLTHEAQFRKNYCLHVEIYFLYGVCYVKFHRNFIWSVQWFCIELGHMKFIRTDDTFLLKRSSRNWCLSFYNIFYQNWRNFGLNLLFLKYFFLSSLLIEISAFEWANFCIIFKTSPLQILISNGRNLILRLTSFFACWCLF